MARLVNDYRTREQQYLVFLRRDLDSVSISPAEPLFRDGRNGLRAPPKDILVVGKVSFSFQVVWSRDVHGEAMVNQREEMLLHNGRDLTVADDLVGLSPGEDSLLDERQLVTLEILERQLIPKTEHLAVDEIEIAARLVLDEEIVALREQLLLEDVAHDRGLG